MGLQVNGRNVAAMRFNGRDAVEARCNGSVVWPTDKGDRLRFVAEQAGSTITLVMVGTFSPVPVLEYSLDAGETWTEFSCDNAPVITLTNVGDTVWMRGENNLISRGPSQNLRFSMSGRIGAYGSILYLLRKDGDFPYLTCLSCLFQDCEALTTAPELPLYTTGRIGEGISEMYSHMFENCKNLTTAPEIHLEHLTMYCCAYMFAGCTSLIKAPKLPATTLYYPGSYYTVENGEGCYYAMFRGCTSLTDAPELPATELSSSCYADMFRECTSLAVPPDLPAETLPPAGDFYGSHSSSGYSCGCYFGMFRDCTAITSPPSISAKYLQSHVVAGSSAFAYMFYGCTNLTNCEILVENPETIPDYNTGKFAYMFYGCSSLSQITVHFKKWSGTTAWVNNVSSTGTFICPTELEETVGRNNIPNGWVVQREGRPYNWARLRITDFRRNGGGSKQYFANAAEIAFLVTIDGEEMTLPILECTANDVLSGYPAKNAFDGDVDTVWKSQVIKQGTFQSVYRVDARMEPFDNIVGVYITPRRDDSDLDYPATFEIQAANGGKHFSVLNTVSGLTSGWEQGVSRLIRLS